MAQWTNLQQTEIFINATQMYITCEKCGGLCLAEPGLTAGALLTLFTGKYYILQGCIMECEILRSPIVSKFTQYAWIQKTRINLIYIF